MKKNVFKILGVILGFLPVLVFAQANTGAGLLSGWTRLLRFILSSLFPIIISLAGIAFMYQIIKFLTTGDTAKREELRASIIWNLGILVAMLGVFAIIRIIASTLGLQVGTDISPISGVGGACSSDSIRGIIMCILKFISGTLIPTAATLAGLAFLWNMTIYLTKTDNQTERVKARDYTMWSLIALGVLLTMFSILNVGSKTIFGSSTIIPQFPTGVSTK